MQLGVCYYPEHWPESQWADDAARMAAMGLSHVRIGEFAWSRIEPDPGRFDWEWLDRAIATLDRAGLKIVLGTPTACPPKWLVDTMPDMLAIDADGRPRGFGSRRHYCFSHTGFAGECDRIVTALAKRYGQHPAVVAWQTDNEYGCHDTAVSYSLAARSAFRIWLAQRYGDIDALNDAWGTIFWSMTYRSFAEIDLPVLTVTTPNPAHLLDFRRFSSDQVVAFNRRQAEILRTWSAGRDIIHNFMGFFTQFDHHAVARDLDVVGWDSYPIGFLEQFWFDEERKQRFERQGDPDIAAFHHDLYRGCARNGRWWVMEQQPGPVNWARSNPAPLPGMVRLWTLEAMAHGAELVSYFRWRQCPFGQEQMHAGLLRPDSVDDVGADEVRRAHADIAALPAQAGDRGDVALLFDYPSCWVTDIEPQASGFSALRTAFAWYAALRRAGLNVDILPPDSDLSGYRLVVIPCMPMVSDDLVQRLAALDGPVLIGPRTGSKTAQFAIPPNLPPGPLQAILPIKVVRVDTRSRGPHRWIETIETARDIQPSGLIRNGHLAYASCDLSPADLDTVIADMLGETGSAPRSLPFGVRVRRLGRLLFIFNYSAEQVDLPDDIVRSFIIGSARLQPADVAVGWLD